MSAVSSRARGAGGRNRGNRGAQGNRNNGSGGSSGRGSRRGRRGGGKGHRHQTDDTTGQNRKAEAAKVAGAAANFLTASGSKVYENDEGSDDGAGDEMCLICCDPLVYVALAPCNHALVCSTCVIRQAPFFTKTELFSLCKATTDRIIVTSDRTRMTWESWSDFIFGDQCGGRLVAYDQCDAFYDSHDGEHLSAIKHLLGFSCGLCSSEAGNCRSLVQLRGHLMGKHKRMLCSVCVEAGRKFISEMPRFSKSQLERHNSRGDPAEDYVGIHCATFVAQSAFLTMRPIPPWWISTINAMCARRWVMAIVFSKDYAMLDRHFGRKHFKCEQPECLEKRFVVFRSEIDLQGHMASHHPNVRCQH